jgi:hypothetical protein
VLKSAFLKNRFSAQHHVTLMAFVRAICVRILAIVSFPYHLAQNNTVMNLGRSDISTARARTTPTPRRKT